MENGCVWMAEYRPGGLEVLLWFEGFPGGRRRCGCVPVSVWEVHFYVLIGIGLLVALSYVCWSVCCRLSCLPYASCEVWFAWFMWYMWLECVDFLWFEIRKVMIFSIKRVLWWFLEVFHGFAIEGLSWFPMSFMICCLKDFHDFGCGFTSLEVL